MSVAFVLGNKLYQHAFPIYRPLYRVYKACSDRAERRLLRKVLFPGAVVVDAGRLVVDAPFAAAFTFGTQVLHDRAEEIAR